jgi:NADH dehydrogenase
MRRIVVVGGGAGGLELVSKLARKYRRSKDVEVLLVDSAERHLWKPLLHEVATGIMDVAADALEYRAHALHTGYSYRYGELENVDRGERRIRLAPMLNSKGMEILPRRYLKYDYLVIAVGSLTNDFGTPGVAEHCFTLDRSGQAVLFHQELMEELLRFSGDSEVEPVRVAIVGGGATGVELSAELHHVVEELQKYAPKHITEYADAHADRYFKVTLVEAGPRLLPPLPEETSSRAKQALGVDVKVSTMITEVLSEGLRTKDGELIPACISVWAAGVKAPDFLGDIAGLETNRINQLVVGPSLQTSCDPRIFAIGDCASYEMSEGIFVPPRAQSAHQMADRCYKNLLALVANENAELKPFVYSDMGSLVNLAKYKTFGAMIAPLFGKDLMFEGAIARMFYLSLYRMHQSALHGHIRTVFFVMAGRVHRTVRRMIKLH